TNEIYVGSTMNFKKRKASNLRSLKIGDHHSYSLQEAFNNHGEENFIFYAYKILTLENPDDLLSSLNREMSPDEKLKELKRNLKRNEQNCFRNMEPEFNVEKDSRGERHWRNLDKYKY